MNRLVVLLPPSEGKAEGGRGRFTPRSGAFRTLGTDRATVLDALGDAARGPGVAKRFGLRGHALARAIAVDQHLLGAPVLPAHLRYTGVVWQYLDPATLGRAARTRAEDAVVVVSGLLGLAGFADPVPDYRAKMSATLPPLGKLSTWWRPRLTDVLATRVAGAVVVDLLPNEHAAAFDRDALAEAARRYLRVEFTRPGGAAVGHGAKAAKGRVARAVLEAPTRALDRALGDFRIPGGTPVGAWRGAGFRGTGPVTTVRIATR